MQYSEIKPSKDLSHYINFFWELKGSDINKYMERVFPDGCVGILTNLGTQCLTDNGSMHLEFGKTYVVGAMKSFKDSVIDINTHLLGVCFKPATISNFYDYFPQVLFQDNTLELDKGNSFDMDKISNCPFEYLNQFFTQRNSKRKFRIQSVLDDIDSSNGQLKVEELSKRNYITVRQLERQFKKQIGMSPKEYSNIIRFQNAWRLLKNSDKDRSILDIAFECGYYDHSHLTSEIKRITGRLPSQL
jgi:AraC-like DNA-binding protein